jgi:hypothetical protein
VTLGVRMLLNEDADHQDERHAKKQDDVYGGDNVD